MNFRIIRSPEAQANLRSLNPLIRRRATQAMRKLVEGPEIQDSKPLRGHKDVWSLRLGRWRMIYRVDHDASEMHIIRVGRRETVYEGFELPPDEISPRLG